MSFGADGPATFRHGAKFVQRILQGKQPKDIPIEQPTKFELAINLRTAKAIGLLIPKTFLQRADAVSTRTLHCHARCMPCDRPAAEFDAQRSRLDALCP